MTIEWRRPGHATGWARCKLAFPAIDLSVERRASGGNAVPRLARYLKRCIPPSEETWVGGSFVISVEMRSRGMGSRWRPVCRWRAGESIDDALQRAIDTWAALSKEDHRPVGK